MGTLLRPYKSANAFSHNFSAFPLLFHDIYSLYCAIVHVIYDRSNLSGILRIENSGYKCITFVEHYTFVYNVRVQPEGKHEKTEFDFAFIITKF